MYTSCYTISCTFLGRTEISRKKIQIHISVLESILLKGHNLFKRINWSKSSISSIEIFLSNFVLTMTKIKIVTNIRTCIFFEKEKKNNSLT